MPSRFVTAEDPFEDIRRAAAYAKDFTTTVADTCQAHATYASEISKNRTTESMKWLDAAIQLPARLLFLLAIAVFVSKHVLQMLIARRILSRHRKMTRKQL